MLLPLQKARQLGPIGCLRNWSYAPKTQPVQLIRGPMTKQDSCLGESWSAGSKLPLWCRRSGFEFAMARAQLAFRFTFLDVMDGQMDADRARGRSLSPMRPATREVLVQDAWAQRHLRTLRQGQNATVVDTTAPSRAVWDTRPCATNLASLLQGGGTARKVWRVALATISTTTRSSTRSSAF